MPDTLAKLKSATKTLFTMRVTRRELQRWQRVAKKRGTSVTGLVRRHLERLTRAS